MLELKSDCPPSHWTAQGALNRTMLELKCDWHAGLDSARTPLNRTMLELKYAGIVFATLLGTIS